MKKLFLLSLLMLVAVNAPAFGMFRGAAARATACWRAAQKFVQQRPVVTASMGVGAAGVGLMGEHLYVERGNEERRQAAARLVLEERDSFQRNMLTMGTMTNLNRQMGYAAFNRDTEKRYGEQMTRMAEEYTEQCLRPMPREKDRKSLLSLAWETVHNSVSSWFRS